MKRILLIRGGAIGDFVLTLPAIKLMRDRFPESHLEILGYKHIIALAENRGYANATRSIEYAALASFFARNADLPSELADYFARFDLIVSYLFDPDAIFERNLKRCGVENFIIGPAKIAANGIHAAQQLMQPMAELGLSSTDLAACLYPTEADRIFAQEFLGDVDAPLVAIHPGSGGENKNWPIDRWIELINSLDPEFGFLLVSGEADKERTVRLHSSTVEKRVLLASQLPLPHLAAILGRCRLFIGHDSGISHIAAAVGTPNLLLFGPTDPRIWSPIGEHVRVLSAPEKAMAGLSVERVIANAANLLGAQKSLRA